MCHGKEHRLQRQLDLHMDSAVRQWAVPSSLGFCVFIYRVANT